MAKRKSNSRSARWFKVASDAKMLLGHLRCALDDLESIRSEYEEWRDNLPENLQSSALAEKLNTVCNLDFASCLDEADNAVQEAVNADLPFGFGRD